LIVDDVAMNTILLEDLVGALGTVETVSFTDSLAALAWCETNEPDLILLDYVMPQLGGIEILRRLREISHIADVPVIMVTALEDRDSRLMALQAGANDFVSKPYDEVELLARSRSMLKLRAATLEQKRLATTDDLTGLPNRRYFLSRLAEEAQRATRFPGHPLSVAMVDIDHFKNVNDSLGHAAGDIVLKRVAETCRTVTRNIDLVGRIGGEEFGIIMPETNLLAARLGCERLRANIAAKPVMVQGMELPITISVGVADFRVGDPANDLLARADAALCRAKQNGRNQVSD
jgi:diguanylate cyclase (GGDEF)-like protein